MANKKITELNAASSLAATDVVPVVDVSADETKKITTTNLFRTLPDGTAAAPALAFSSDAANGVYLAGTDTVGISTGGTQRVTVDGSGNVSISGDLTVNGATTTVQSTTVTIDDKNIELGSVATPTNTTADGGGITLKGATDKTIKWINSTGCWTFNQPMNFNDHVRIDSSGNVGIATTHADFKLDVGGPIGLFESNNIVWHDGTGTRAGQLGFTSGEVFTIKSSNSQTERLRIDSSGDVGIGTSSPRAKVDFGPGSGQGTLNQTLSNYQAVFEAPQGTGNISRNIAFAVTTGGICAAINATDEGANNATGLMFATGTAGSIAERLRIDENGNVGIGTTSPGSKLHVSDNTAPPLEITRDQAIGGSGILLRQPNTTDGNDLRISYESDTTGTGAASNVQFAAIEFTAATHDNSTRAGEIGFYTAKGGEGFIQRMRIDSSGRLMLGTTTEGQSEADDLTIATSGHTGMTIRSGTTSKGALYFSDGTSGNSEYRGYIEYNHQSDFLRFGTAAAEKVRIDSSGRLLVGTTTEGNALADNLTVADSGNCGLTLRSGTSNYGSIYFSDGTSGASEYRGQIEYNHSTDALSIYTAASSAMRIDSSANVGIGTTSPGTKLDVNGAAKANYAIASGGLAAYASSTGGLYSYFASTAGHINAVTDNSGTAGTLIFATGSERMRIDSSGQVGIGASSPTSVLDIRDTQTGAASEIKLFNLDQGNTTTQTSALVMTPDVRANGAKISVVKENADFSSSANKDVAITFAPVSNNTATERLRIDSLGDVTITSTGSLKLPVGTTAERPSSAAEGMIRRNTTDSAFEGYTGTAWAPLGGGATGGGSDAWVVETDQTVTTSYELGSGKHGTTVSPTINSGATVTVPSGAILVIL